MLKKLTPARLTMLMFMAVGGLIAAYIAKGILAVDKSPPKPPERRNVPMALSEIPAGTLIRDEHLGLGPVYVKDLTSDVILQSTKIVGRVAKEAIKPAEPIRGTLLYEKGILPPLKVSAGRRAVTIDIGTTAMVDGLIKPGDYVDVLYAPDNANNDPRLNQGLSLTLFRAVKVLAINRQYRQGDLDNNDANSVTLELTGYQANAINLTRERGRLLFAFNPEGKSAAEDADEDKDRANFEQILGLEPIKAPEPPPPPFVTQVYRRTMRHEIEFRPESNRVIESTGGYGGFGDSGAYFPTWPNQPAQPAPAAPDQKPGTVRPTDPAGGIRQAPDAVPGGAPPSDAAVRPMEARSRREGFLRP
jgi:Flp pilus assembly protein CpaB